MQKFLFLALAGACSTVAAQTPATNPMPDGSRDMFVGIGVQYVPRYEGARDRRALPMPALQIQWSNGIFLSGNTLGMHLSPLAALEFGPLLAVSPRRDQDGLALGIGGIGEGSGGGSNMTTILPGGGGFVPGGTQPAVKSDNKLLGLDVVERRVLYGGFLNYYLSPKLRLSNHLMYGVGRERDGARLYSSVQYMMEDVAPHHTLVLAAGLSLVNAAHSATWFGVTKAEGERTEQHAYSPRGGLQDVRASVRWNWALGPSWMLTSGAQLTRLLGDAKNSPLVERATNLSVSTALAYRF